jgi:uncharacterized protein (DUF1697 family)
MICPARELLNLAKENPFAGDRNDDIDAHVSIMRERLAKIPKLPIYAPSKNKWEIKILDVVGTAVLSLRRRVKNGRLYPNAIVEKQFGVAATTRSWNTIEKVATVLRKDSLD